MDSLTMQVRSLEGEVLTCSTPECWPPKLDGPSQREQDLSWPVRVPVIPKGNDPERTFEVIVDALVDGEILVRNRAVAGFIAGKERTLVLRLADACRGVGDICASSGSSGCHGAACEVCRAGSCEEVGDDAFKPLCDEGQTREVPCAADPSIELEQSCSDDRWVATGECGQPQPGSTDCAGGIKDGEADERVRYAAAQVAVGAECMSETQYNQCEDGELSGWSGTYEATSCAVLSQVDCTDAEPLPDAIDADLEVGPGCVSVESTTIRNGAVLTILPGTRVLMGRLLRTGRSNTAEEPGLLHAVGTPEAPIVFTSAQDSPAPGDWECLSLWGEPEGSRLEHAVLEFGGAACNADGSGQEAALLVEGAAEVRNVTIRNSSGYGSYIRAFSAAPVAFADVRFEDNAYAGLRVAIAHVTALGPGLSFGDSDDYILIHNPLGGTTRGGTWRNPGVPFLTPSGIGITADQTLTLEPGLTILFETGSFNATAATLIAVGTEQDPSVLSSGSAEPQAGDWGCVRVDEDDRLEHTVLEYAGSGNGCTGAKHNTAVLLSGVEASGLSDLHFRSIQGSAIQTSTSCAEPSLQDLCSANLSYEDLSSTSPLLCSRDVPLCE